MQHRISDVSDIATLIRATRKAADMRIDDLASTAGLSKQFVGDVESAKPTAQLGLVLKLMKELGIHLYVDVPSEALSRIDDQRMHVRKRSLERESTRKARRTQPKTNPTK